jgi:DNA-directed RNA polymerase beta subunit
MFSPEEKKQQIHEWMKKTVIDPDVVNKTLGKNTGHINPSLLLEATKKLIKINKLEEEPDNRDDIRFNTFHSLEDFVHEHIDKDAGKLQQKAKIKMQQKKNLSWLHAGFFSPQIKSIIAGGSQLSQSLEGHNPVDNFDLSTKVTKLGPGGIPGVEAVPDESRNVNSSYFGFLDPFRISESKTVGVDHRFSHNVVKGRDNKIYRLMLDKNKKPVWIDHETFLDSKVHIPEF